MDDRDRGGIGRRGFLGYAALGTAVAITAPMVAATPAEPAETGSSVPPFELEEITIGELQEGMKSGRISSKSVTEAYLARIDAIDKRGPGINAIIELNPDALSIAEALDRERKEQGSRGPLHGVPVLITANTHTTHLIHTTPRPPPLPLHRA